MRHDRANNHNSSEPSERNKPSEMTRGDVFQIVFRLTKACLMQCLQFPLELTGRYPLARNCSKHRINDHIEKLENVTVEQGTFLQLGIDPALHIGFEDRRRHVSGPMLDLIEMIGFEACHFIRFDAPSRELLGSIPTEEVPGQEFQKYTTESKDVAGSRDPPILQLEFGRGICGGHGEVMRILV